MSQSLSNVLLHIVFSTKNRQPFIDEDIAPELYLYMTGIAVSLGSFVHKMGGIEDHVHLFLTLPRTLSVSDLVAELKRGSSKWIKTKQEKYSNFSWQKGFGVFSVEALQHQALITYISNQKEHHKTQCYKDEYRKFLKRNNISFDERYVWD